MILNLTQHPATPSQIEAGVIDLPESGHQRATLHELLTFHELPTADDIEGRAIALAALAAGHVPGVNEVMIGGASWLMPALERALKDEGIQPLYAFSLRESAQSVRQDGSTREVNVFHHVGFINA